MARPKSHYRKRIKSINFDEQVINALEDYCRREHTTVSNYVNWIVRQHILTEKDYLRALAKHHNSELQRLLFQIKMLDEDQTEDKGEETTEDEKIL